MTPTALRAALAALALAAVSFAAGRLSAEAFTPRGFRFTATTEVPLAPPEAFDAFTGDVSPWWDHTFSGAPAKLVIEPVAGGGFWEHFDDAGNGVLHARVTWAERGKRLVLRGPLGLHGRAADLVFSLTFEAAGDGTRVTVEGRGSGELGEGDGAVVKSVWEHFLGRYAEHARAR